MTVHVNPRFLWKIFPSLALAVPLLILGTGAAWAGGTIDYSPDINWKGSSNLYFYVSGGPPNTCGSFNSIRNGSPLTVNNYVCTDATGSVTMGPWTWSSGTGDQTDTQVYVRWPDGSTTNQIWHIWDRLAPSIFLDPYSGTPPSSWSGSATDPQWGAGFSSSYNSRVQTYFKNTSTGLYWTPTSGGYTANPICNAVQPIRCLPRWINGTLYGMPSHSVDWDTPFPPASAHSSPNSYEWKTCVYDNYSLGQSNCVTITFSM